MSERHFFQPLLPGFEDNFSIPIAFFKSLKIQECEQATLRSRHGKLWPVKIKGRRFQDGWKQFAQYHHLNIGDFLVFRHEVDLLFDVIVFDRSTCEKEPPQGDDTEIQPLDIPVFSSSGKKLEEKKKVRCGLEAKPSNSVVEHPYCVIKLKPDSFNFTRLPLPQDFATEHRLFGRCCSMILKDKEGKCWPAKLLFECSDNKSFIVSGWTEFQAAHKLKTGDLLVIELIRNEKIPVLKLQRLQEHPEVKPQKFARQHFENKNNSKPTLINREGRSRPAKINANSSNDKPIFYVTMLASYARNCQMRIPRQFSRRYGLDSSVRSKLIVRNEEGNSWKLALKVDKCGSVYIRNGWTKFAYENGIKVGDVLMFELVKGETTHLMKFHAVKVKPEMNRC